MSDNSLTLLVRSPDDKVPDQTVLCNPSWLVRDLKEHISNVFPQNPEPNSQRLIYAGKLLLDDIKLDSIFKNVEVGIPPTVHVVFRPSVTRISAEKSAVTSQVEDFDLSSIPEAELEQYKREYFQYLQNFYMANSSSINCPPGWPYSCSGFPQANATPGNRETTRPEQPEAAAEPPEGGLIPRLRALLPNRGAAEGADPFANEAAGEADIVDQFYMIFRLALFIGLCLAYSSLDKAIIVFCIAAYVYLFNIYRLHDAARPGRNVEAAQQTDEAQHETNDPPAQPELQRAPFSRIGGALRSAASVSYQFLSSLLSSLIPEQPPPMRLD